MHPWFVPLFFIFFLAVLGLVTVIVIIVNRKQEIKEEKDFFLNMANLKDGVAYGVVEKLEKSPVYDRWKFEGESRDRNLKSLLEKFKPKKTKFIVENAKVMTFSKGKWSAEKNIHWLLPISSKDLPQEIQNHEFGKALALAIEINNSDSIIINAMQEGINRLNSHVTDLNIGEASIAQIGRIEDLFKDVDNIYKEKSKKEGGFGGYNRPTTTPTENL